MWDTEVARMDGSLAVLFDRLHRGLNRKCLFFDGTVKKPLELTIGVRKSSAGRTRAARSKFFEQSSEEMISNALA